MRQFTPGCIAMICHPKPQHAALNGAFCRCDYVLADNDPDRHPTLKTWRITLIGEPKRDDWGQLVRWGFIPQAYLILLDGPGPGAARVAEALELTA